MENDGRIESVRPDRDPTSPMSVAGTAVVSGRCSVLISCRHGARYVGRALESVAAQSYADWEIVVVEDGPDDATESIVRKFADANPGHEIRFVMHETNRGVAAARNTGLGLARGEFVCPLDYDDWYEPEFLARCVGAARETGADVVFTGFRELYEETDRRVEQCPGEAEMAARLRALDTRNCILNSASMIRTETLRGVGRYDEDRGIEFVEDWDLWLRLRDAGARFHYVPSPLASYRLHAGQATARMIPGSPLGIRLSLKHLRRAGTLRGMRHRQRIGAVHLEAALRDWPHSRRDARRHLISSLGAWPFRLRVWWLLAKTVIHG